MSPGSVTIPLAFLAGMASFLSPCVLALVPAYIGYLSGRSVTAEGVVVENRWETFGHGLAFVAGFSVVFISLGAAASLIGAVLYDLRIWLARIGGVIVVIFGLHTMGVINIPFLNYDTRRQMRPKSGMDYGSSAMMGGFFGRAGDPFPARRPGRRPGSRTHAPARPHRSHRLARDGRGDGHRRRAALHRNPADPGALRVLHSPGVVVGTPLG